MEETTEAPAKKSSKRRATDGGGESSMSAKRPRDSKLVRISPALPVGAIEPFLVQKAATSSSKAPAATRATSERGKPPSGDEMVRIEHEPGCPLAGGVASIDMTQPGAFAKAICRCQVKNKAGLLTSSNTIVVRQAPEENIRTPSEADRTHRVRVHLGNPSEGRGHREEPQGDQREATKLDRYVGAVSRARSLLQSGRELLLVDHRALSRETFYQLELVEPSNT